MYVWFVTIFDGNEPPDRGEPFVSPEVAMHDICYRHLDWKYIQNPKFGGTVLEHWEAFYQGKEYILDKEYVVGSDNE